VAVSRTTTCRQCGAQFSAVRLGGLCPLCQQSDAEGDTANEALGNEPSVAPACRKPTLASAIASLSAKLFGGPRFGKSQKQPQADALCNLGLALARQGKVDEAIARFRAAIRIKPNHGAAHNNLGLALEAQGKFDEAITEYRKAVHLRP
jgi:Flp pilus assembly protein TadD